MELLLQKNMPLADINKSFQRHFPYLKLKFYRSDHLSTRRYSSEELSLTTILNEVVGNFLPTVIEFSPADTIDIFERRLKSEMGLRIRVFRKNNEGWVETRQTRCLSLDTQNSLGSVTFHVHYNDHTLFL
jgi:hypothetical protein